MTAAARGQGYAQAGILSALAKPIGRQFFEAHMGEGRNYVVLHHDPTAHAELLAVRDAARRLKRRELSDCEVYSTATPCAMYQGALYWARIRRYHNESTPEGGIAPKLTC